MSSMLSNVATISRAVPFWTIAYLVAISVIVLALAVLAITHLAIRKARPEDLVEVLSQIAPVISAMASFLPWSRSDALNVLDDAQPRKRTADPPNDSDC